MPYIVFAQNNHDKKTGDANVHPLFFLFSVHYMTAAYFSYSEDGIFKASIA